VRDFYAESFRNKGKKITAEVLEKVVQATLGYPYLLQLIGYYVLKHSEGITVVDEQIAGMAINSARQEMTDTIFKTVLAPLSDNDVAFLKAMSKDKTASKVADIGKRMKKSDSYIQQYRRRLLDAGVILPQRRGYVEYAVPYLGEYLRGEI